MRIIVTTFLWLSFLTVALLAENSSLQPNCTFTRPGSIRYYSFPNGLPALGSVSYNEPVLYERFLLDAAMKGQCWAQYALGRLYLSGEGIPKNMEKSEEWLSKAAFQNHLDAMVDLAELYNRSQSFEKSMKWYEKAAKMGCWNAIWPLANMRRNGRGCVKDLEEAYMWYEILTGNDPNPAINNPLIDFAKMKIAKELTPLQVLRAEELADKMWKEKYDSRRDMRQEALKGITILEDSAKKGDALAQRTLGLSYLQGQVVVKNHEKAVLWLEKAAEKDDVYSMLTLGKFFFMRLRNFEIAGKWYLKAAKKNDSSAMMELASMYYRGMGTPKNLVFAYAWFMLAQKTGKCSDNNTCVWYLAKINRDLTLEQKKEAMNYVALWETKKDDGNTEDAGK